MRDPLIESGAEVNLPDPELGGCYPLQLSVDIECEDSCRRYEMGDLQATPRATITRLLVCAGAEPDLIDPNGASARSWAEERDTYRRYTFSTQGTRRPKMASFED